MMLTWDAQGQHGTTARCITLTRIAEALRKVIESKRSNGSGTPMPSSENDASKRPATSGEDEERVDMLGLLKDR